MKKSIYSLAAFILMIGSAGAKHVDLSTAKQVAENFMYRNARMSVLELQLSYTARSTAGMEDYYVFNINGNTGFVIVSGDDVATPVIGYSTEGPFVAPEAGTNFAYWMGKRQMELEYIRVNNLQQSTETSTAWAELTSAASSKYTPPVFSTAVAPLCAATWDQQGYYNDLCPGGSMTGCVATAMAIIMKKWSYPTKGTGSSSYNAGSYGTLSANYGATTYNWSSMTTPKCLSPNNAVATIMYHCGVSVQMAYSPSGSGALIIGGNPSAQYSYKTYFGYNASSIKGLVRTSYQDPQWIALLKADLDKGQPIQYAGYDQSAGGHTWVCDGYDNSGNFHMNWGWSGSNNGNYNINNLVAGGFSFADEHQVCIGIVPMVALDAGISAIGLPTGSSNGTTINPMVYVKNFGLNTVTSCTVNYKVDNGPVQTYPWTGSLATNGVSTVSLPSMNVTVGTHTFTCYTTSPNSGSDGNVTNDLASNVFGVVATGIQDLNGSQGFSIYPNPAVSYVNVEGTASGNVRYSLCNLLGEEMQAGNVSSTGSNFSDRIDVSALPKGLYLLRVTDGDSSFTKKLNKL